MRAQDRCCGIDTPSLKLTSKLIGRKIPNMPDTPEAVSVSFEAFTRIDLRIGVIVAAEKIEKSDKLLKLLVDLGSIGLRTVVAGIGKAYSPESLLGISCIVVSNLVPRTVYGVESHGMLICGQTETGALTLAACPNGKPGEKVH